MTQTAADLWRSDTTGYDLPPAPAGPPRAGQLRIDYSQARSVTLDTGVLEENRVLTGNAPGPFAESYHLLRAQILHRFRENGRNSLAITSPREGAGKTLTAINLAISMARMVGYTVLLVDTNLRRPAVLGHLGLPEGWGLGDYLADDVAVEKLLIRSAHFDDLVILPGGEPLHDSYGPLNSRQMKQLTLDLKTRAHNHIVIFDLPPVLASTEANSLARQSDTTLLVIEDGVTTKQDTELAVEMIGSDNLAGTVLNKARAPRRKNSGFFFQ
ncbi:MAG: CpsD/CapB family tyrosine-protein kinase [Gammaproteobacteria bacterium]